ncbi:MAG: 6-pyruvoyl-tetrahydropterin synthase-related protein, partial [Chloroflexota bacterium]
MYNQIMSRFQQSSPSYELPDWMRLAQRGVDWGFMLVLVLCIIVSAPFAMRNELPHNNANENYVYRTNDYAESIQEGWLYPRWSPNVLGGYGAPIPSFYPPAPAYAAALLQVLLTNSPVSAVRLLYILATCIAGIAVYALVMRRSGAAAGVLAAMIYIYSPYTSLIIPHVQGDLTEMLVLALSPALLWATDRLIRGQQPQNMLFVTLCTAGLILTSPKGAAASGLLAVAYVIWQFQQIKIRGKLFQLTIAIGLGILLAGFYWIPAILEESAIHWQPSIASDTFTLRLTELITPIMAIDPAEMIHHPQLTLGLVGLIFAAGGALIHVVIKRKFDFGVFFLISGLVITIIAVTVLRHETWLLGLIVLCLSVAGSDILLLRENVSPRLQRMLLPIMMITIWIGSRAIWLPPTANQPFGNTDGAAQITYEQQGYG